MARDLLGRTLVHETRGRRVAGRIVEVEAYGGRDDPASHARPGPTRRNASMFGPPGHAYVYLSHGLHWCFNVVTGPAGRASAVLVRALEPGEGISRMARRRGTRDPRRLASGPGRVGQALGLGRGHDGADLVRGRLWISRARIRRAGERIERTARIGIRVGLERRWRFVLVPGRPGSRRRGTPRSR